MLDMLSMCLGGGMSISASLEHVAKNLTSYPALSDELNIMRRQADVGSLRLALTDWASRIDTPEVRQVATLLTRGDARALRSPARCSTRPIISASHASSSRRCKPIACPCC